MIPTRAWEERGRHVDTPDGRVFALRDGPDGGERAPALILHGFPTSSWDFARCVERIHGSRPVVAFDFLGFGLSDKPERYAYSLMDQADVACQVVRAFHLTRVHLWGHDMGTSVATELLARRERGVLPFEVASVTLMNGSVHLDMAQLTLGQKALRSRLGPLFARVMTRAGFALQMKRLFARPVADDEVDAMWTLLARDDGALRMPAISGYMAERVRFRDRWIGALERLDVPALVAWGRKDPVAVEAIAARLAREIPGARAAWWDDLGHYPQVEDPDAVARTVGGFWSSVDARGRG